MNYKNFVRMFMKADNDDKKAELVRKHIKNDYVPYEKKIAEARKIIELADYVDVQGKKTYKRNSPMTYLLFIIRLLANYTDFEWENGKEEMDVYNLLTKNGIITTFISVLPDNEYDEFSTVLRMTEDDEYENYRSFAGFMESKVEAINLALNALTEVIPQIEQQ